MLRIRKPLSEYFGQQLLDAAGYLLHLHPALLGTSHRLIIPMGMLLSAILVPR